MANVLPGILNIKIIIYMNHKSILFHIVQIMMLSEYMSHKSHTNPVYMRLMNNIFRGYAWSSRRLNEGTS